MADFTHRETGSRKALSNADLAAFARITVPIKEVFRVSKPAITTLLHATGKLVDNKIDTQRTPDGWIMTCFNPEHTDRNPSLHVSERENRWWCWGCDIGDRAKASTIDLILAIEKANARIPDVARQRHSIDVRTLTAWQARDEVIEIGRQLGLVVGEGTARVAAERQAVKVERDVEGAEVCARIIDALVERELEMRQDGGMPKALLHWLIARAMPPADLFGRVVWFGCQSGYDYLRERFSDAELSVAGFVSVMGKEFLNNCHALFVFRDPDGRGTWAQGFKIPVLEDACERLEHRAALNAMNEQRDPLCVTGTESPEELIALRDRARDEARARTEASQNAKKVPPKYLGLAQRRPPWPFGADRAARGSVTGTGTLAICEGVPDALAAELGGECEAALAFPGVGTAMVAPEVLRALLLTEAGKPKWGRIVVAFDSDVAGELAWRAFLKSLADAAIPCVTHAEVLAAARAGEPLRPAQLEDTLLILRRTTRGKDINDSIGLV